MITNLYFLPIVLISIWGVWYIEFIYQEKPIEVFPENIEYCQNVYMTWENPLDQECDFDQVKRSLSINF